MNKKEGDNAYSIFKIPIAILTLFIVLLIAKYFFDFEFGHIKKINPTEIEFYEPNTAKETTTVKEEIPKNKDESESKKNDLTETILSLNETDIRLRSLEITKRVTDVNGEGIEDVEVWCSNCLSKKRITTDKNGDFSLLREFILNDELNHQITICFRYKTQEDCINSQFKYLNQIEVPKFIKK